MRKLLLSFLMLFAMSTMTFAETATFNFVGWGFDGADQWKSGYEEHSVKFDIATVTFEKANRQSEGQVISDCPVTKGNDVTVVLNDMDSYDITGVNVTLKQWGTKEQTATLQYSGDGSVFSETGTTSDNFVLTNNDLADGTKAVKITFSSQSNQVGIASIELNYESASGAVVVSAPTFSPVGGTYYEAQNVTLTASEGATIYYTINGDEPDASSTEYTAPINVAETTTIKAIAMIDDVASKVSEATYTIEDLFYNEDFEETDGDYTMQNVELSEGLTSVWTWDESFGQLKASAYVNKVNLAGESWMVSPEIDLTGAEQATLKLTEIINFLSGNDVEDYCKIMVSTDYAGDVTKATWEQIKANGRAEGKNWDEFTIEPVDLANYVGKKMYLGFSYNSTTSAAPTWEVLDITISGKKTTTPPVGIEDAVAGEAVKAIGLDGRIAIIGEAADVEVFNMGGALIAKGNLNEVNCQAGAYIVKVDGEAQKVIVK